MAAVECRPREAMSLAGRAAQIARVHRNPGHEGRALLVVRTAMHRTGAAIAPDTEFVDAAARIGLPSLAAGAALTEAAIAWSTGDAGSCRQLAMAAAAARGSAPAGDLARALASAAGEALDDAVLQRCRTCATQSMPPAVGLQALALIAIARPQWLAVLQRDARTLRLPRSDRDVQRIREVTSVAGAWRLLAPPDGPFEGPNAGFPASK
jgi:hypothetical protein